MAVQHIPFFPLQGQWNYSHLPFVLLTQLVTNQSIKYDHIKLSDEEQTRYTVYVTNLLWFVFDEAKLS